MAHRATHRPPGPSPKDTAGGQRLPPLLRRAWYGLNQAFRRRIAHLRITPDQYTVLRTLAEQPGLTQQELTRRMTSDPNTVASLVRRMERAGLLSRTPDARDRRARRLELEPAGRRQFEAAQALALALQGEVLAALSKDERPRFLRQLALVSTACQHAAGNGAGG